VIVISSTIRSVTVLLLLTACSFVLDPSPSLFEGNWEGSFDGLSSLYEAGGPPINLVLLRVSDNGEVTGTARFIDRSRPTDGNFGWDYTMDLELTFRGIVFENGQALLEADWICGIHGLSEKTGRTTFTGRLSPSSGGTLHWQGPFPAYADDVVAIRVHPGLELAPRRTRPIFGDPTGDSRPSPQEM